MKCDLTYFEKLHKEWKDDPDYLYEELILDFTEKICEVAEKKNIPLRDIPSRAGISKKLFTLIMRGEHEITLKEMVKLAVALESKLDINFKEIE